MIGLILASVILPATYWMTKFLVCILTPFLEDAWKN
jgi:hypothetical protein